MWEPLPDGIGNGVTDGLDDGLIDGVTDGMSDGLIEGSDRRCDAVAHPFISGSSAFSRSSSNTITPRRTAEAVPAKSFAIDAAMFGVLMSPSCRTNDLTRI